LCYAVIPSQCSILHSQRLHACTTWKGLCAESSVLCPTLNGLAASLHRLVLLEVELIRPKKLLHNLLTLQHSCNLAADRPLGLWLAATLPVVVRARKRAGWIYNVIAPSCSERKLLRRIHAGGLRSKLVFSMFRIGSTRFVLALQRKNQEWESFPGRLFLLPGRRLPSAWRFCWSSEKTAERKLLPM
jgi:hypothetical protein